MAASASRFNAKYDMMTVPLSIDITTGDVITPNAVLYEFYGIFDESAHIDLWAYNIETIMAEKMESILSRGIFNTRIRDFYDVYVLVKLYSFDHAIFKQALAATAAHRGKQLNEIEDVLKSLSDSEQLRSMWRKYQLKFSYAKEITYDDTIQAVMKLARIYLDQCN